MASEMVHAGAVAVRGIQAALDIVKGALEAWRASPSQVGNPAGDPAGDPAVANSLVTAAYAFRVAAREAVAGAGVPASAIATAAERVATPCATSAWRRRRSATRTICTRNSSVSTRQSFTSSEPSSPLPPSSRRWPACEALSLDPCVREALAVTTTVQR